MHKSLVSVVVPVYNAEKYIEETILSIINQTYKNMEILLINHNCTDNSVEIMQKYASKDKRIKIINLDVNKGGPAYPRNVGIEQSTGEYIAFLDADDVWLKDKLIIQLKFMFEKDLDFSSTNEVLIDERSRSLKKSKKEHLLKFITTKHNLNALLIHNYIVNSSVVVKSILAKNYKFDEDKLLIAIEDYYLWLELMLNKYNYSYCKEPLVRYRVLINSAVQRDNYIKNQARRNYVFSKLCLKYENGELLKNIYRLNGLKYIKKLFL